MPVLLLASLAGAGPTRSGAGREHSQVRAALAPMLGEGLFVKYHGPVLIGLMVLTAVVLLASNRRRRRAEAQLRRAHDELEQRVRQRTEQVEASNRGLRDSRAFLQSVVDAIPSAVMVVNRDRRIVLANEQARAMAQGADIVARRMLCHQLTRGSDVPCSGTDSACTLQQVLETGGPVTLTQKYADDGTGERVVEVSAAPIFATDGQIRQIVAAFRDVTAQRQAARELADARDVAEAASRTKSEFLANVSHEIRTPLNGILGMTDLALDTSLTEEQQEYLAMVRDSGRALMQIINDILDFSKIEAGKLDLNPEAFRLRESLQRTLQPMVMRAASHGVDLRWTTADDVPDDLVGDALRLRQIVVNLVGNALKFTETGEIVVAAEVQKRDEHDVYLHVTVRDTGIGISPDRQQAIFRAFEQADGSMTRRFGGTGLGLTISSQLAGMMGGSMWVESEVGQGSTFHFSVRFSLPRPGQEMASASEAAGAAEAAPLDEAGPLRVLLAEDNAVNQKLACRLLEKRGHTVLLAGNGREALEWLRRETVDVVLMDVQMPEMDGLEATAAIRRDDEARGTHTPVIAMTAHAMRGHREICLRAGMDGYVTKPVRPGDLFAAIATVLFAAAPTAPDGEGECSNAAPGERTSGERTDTRVFDVAAALDRVEGDVELLAEMADIFLDQLEELRAQMDRDLAEGNMEALARLAHTLKGASGNLDARRTFEAALNLETAARDEDPARCQSAHATLNEELSLLADALAEYARKAQEASA